LIDTFLKEYKQYSEALSKHVYNGNIEQAAYFTHAASILKLLKQAEPEQPLYASRLAECYHLDGQLRKAAVNYRAVMDMQPLHTLTDRELRAVHKLCPVLMTHPAEPFPLKDFIAVHHPTEPLIGYHLFWEDDYDFPDDHEPCDHEEVWIAYDRDNENVTGVMCWFHSRVLSSESAVEEARSNGGRAVIRIEWGKHGSLLHGWEQMEEPLGGIRLTDWMRRTYEHVKVGGRVPEHPLKKFWPDRFEGSWDDYISFTETVDPINHLHRKPLILKTEWVNAALFTYGVPYNFHPKMEWPTRFQER
jgi:hypothetical protein